MARVRGLRVEVGSCGFRSVLGKGQREYCHNRPTAAIVLGGVVSGLRFFWGCSKHIDEIEQDVRAYYELRT